MTAFSFSLEEIQRQVREAFTQFVGQPTGDNVRCTFENLDLGTLMYPPQMRQLWVELGLVSVGCGCPRKACEQLKALSQPDLDFLYETCGAGPGNMIWLECATREGIIKSWGTDQETMDGKLRLVFEPKEPIDFIKIDFTLENPHE